MFDTLTDSFKNAIGKIRFHDDEKALKKATTELKKSLLKADVHHKVVKDLISSVEIQTKQLGVGKDNFLKALQTKLTEILTIEGAPKGFTFASKPPTVVLMIGLQGSGKTTTTGKLAYFLKEQKKKKVLVIAADLQRLAAVEQLRQITSQIEVDLVADENAKPVEIVKQGLEKAQKELYDVVLIDTAGRLAIDEELMDELAEVKDVADPDELFYVADAIDPKEAKKVTQKIKKGQFNFNDFLAQMEQMKKLGSMKSIMGMIPGMGNMAKQIGDMDLENSDEIKMIKAMVASMTPKERENPDLLNNTRKRRLAAGAGLDQMQVNRVLKQFKNAAKMAKKMSTKGGMKQMQDMMAQMQSGGGFPGMPR